LKDRHQLSSSNFSREDRSWKSNH